MPYSAHECKSWIVDHVIALTPRRVLDIGPGAGTYADLLMPAMPDLDITGVEVWPPYVEQFDLRTKYTRIIVGNFLTMGKRFEISPKFDVAILGDVIEHFRREDAYEVYELARKISNHVIVSTPIEHWPQGAELGNPYENHLYEFSYEELSGLPGVVDATREGRIGAILASGS